MKVHVLTYGDTYGGVYPCVFTDANLALAERHAELNADPGDRAHDLKTVEIDDPIEIAMLKEDIRLLEEDLELDGEDELFPDVVTASNHEPKESGDCSHKESDKFVGMVLDENVIGVWHFEFDGGNFVATLSKKPGGGMTLASRFRYYRDDKPGPDSQDEKRWFCGDVNNNWTEARAVNVLREASTKMARYVHSTLNEVLMDETGVGGLLAKMQKTMPLSSHPAKAYPRAVQRAAKEMLKTMNAQRRGRGQGAQHAR